VTFRHRPGTGRRSSLRSGLAASALSWVLAACGATAIAVALHDRADPPPQPAAMADAPQWMPPDAAPVSDQQVAPTDPAPAPLRVRIPRLGVNAVLEQLDLNPDGTIGVPTVPAEAGWYRWSAQPGDPGPAVILGHVDAPDVGAAVFYRLGDLHDGDRISVERADGTLARFLVTAVAEFAKAGFPTSAVYGPTTRPALRLITCGDWDPATHSYLGNTVVFADLDDSTPSPSPSPTPSETSDPDTADSPT
jgi:sortase (surface protein transpeptidase)